MGMYSEFALSFIILAFTLSKEPLYCPLVAYFTTFALSFIILAFTLSKEPFHYRFILY